MLLLPVMWKTMRETRLNISDGLGRAGHLNCLMEILTSIRVDFTSPSVSCSDMYISDGSLDEAGTLGREGRRCSDSDTGQ